MYAYMHVATWIFGENSRLCSHNVGDDGKKEICMWGHIFPVTEQSQPITKCCCGLAFPASAPAFHPPSTQKLFYNLPAISQGFRMPFRYVVWLCPKQTHTSGLWTIFLSGFPGCRHLLILFDLQPLFKANKQNLTTS